MTENGVSGKAEHDARLVAAMIGTGLDAILTFNARHFTRFTAIETLSAEKIAAGR